MVDPIGKIKFSSNILSFLRLSGSPFVAPISFTINFLSAIERASEQHAMAKPPFFGHRTRAKGVDTAALEHLKAFHSSCGHCLEADGGFQIKMEEPIYDAITEDCSTLVAHHQKASCSFIIDDVELSYMDEGQEDFSHPSFPESDEVPSNGDKDSTSEGALRLRGTSPRLF